MTYKDIHGSVSRSRLWAGRIIGGLLVAFLVFDGAAKVVQVDAVVKGSAALGLPAYTTPYIGWLLLLCTAVYVIPQTKVLGAILLTGYLGGATAIHVRADDGTFPIVFSVTFGVLLWAALVLREPWLLKTILASVPLAGERFNSPVFEE
jgi:hypothetical protein